MRAWAEFIVAFQRNGGYCGGCPLGTLASELAESDADAREDLAAGYRRWQQAIRTGLTAMADRGEFLPGTDIDRLATEDNPDVPALHGWRLGVFGEDALALRQGQVGLAVAGRKVKLIPNPG